MGIIDTANETFNSLPTESETRRFLETLHVRTLIGVADLNHVDTETTSEIVIGALLAERF